MYSNLHPIEEDLKKFRPIPFYFITTTDSEELSYKSAYTALSKLKAEGFGGIVLFNKPPHGFSSEEYLSETWFDMVTNFAKASKELELKLWINDGFDYPPGSVGGRINREKYPHLTQKRLQLSGDAVIVQEVDWGFPAFEEEESAELFHEYVYEAYLKHVGDYFGNPICGFFSDADNRRVNAAVFAEDSKQKDYFPWSSDFSETFLTEYGYDIQPYLVKVLKKEDGKQVRDYWEHAGRLYQRWFASNYRWCKEHGLEYTFHTSDSSPFVWEEAARSSVYTEGRALDMESNCDYPGTDQELLEINGGKHLRKEEYWVPRVSWAGDSEHVRNPEYYSIYGDLRAKQAGSAAFLYHKKGAMCEMFAASNWGATLTELREIAAWQMMQGITFIVPHAYHHRFRGESKYFAPPFFAPGSVLNESARMLNDTLAIDCYYTSLGKLKAPIAVLDLTDDVWEGRVAGSDTLFDVCEQLNRLPYGYVIADVKSIIANHTEFTVVVNAGAPLKDEIAHLFEAQHLTVVCADELERLQDLIPCDVSYIGEGQPHFMRREMANGEELVILANVEDGKEIKGSVLFEHAKYNVVLQRGELAFFTKQGQIMVEDIPEMPENPQSLSETVPIVWEQENILPLEYWEDENGNCICKDSEESVRRFFYHVEDDGLRGVKFYIPESSYQKIKNVSIDGTALLEWQTANVLDEQYVYCVLNTEVQKGTHCIVIEEQNAFTQNDRIFLQGEFNVEVSCENPYAKKSGEQYSQERFIPQKATTFLRKRSERLSTMKSWSEQGHPFYSGKVTYCFELDMDEEYGDGVLCLPEVRDGCIVALDGQVIGQRIFAPYQFKLNNIGGKHLVEVTVYNSMANAMEFYKAPSGIVSGVKLGKART